MTTPTTPDFIRLLDSEDTGSTSCFFDAAAPATADVVASLGHEPNGYFWEGVVRRLVEKGELDEPDTDPEGGMFCVYGPRPAMERLAHVLTPYLTDPRALTALVVEADAEGFDFDD